MEASQIDALVQRLLANPHDEEALAYAHQAGAADPKSYALLLERVGSESRDPAYASHWLSEAANVWSTTVGDAHRAARVLMQAIDRDPTQRTAAERLAQLYRDKGDVKALVALLERRAKALGPLAAHSPEVHGELAAMHEELGRLWGESLQQPKKALENFRRAIELEPTNVYAIYGAREIYKAQGQLDDAVQMYAAEIAVEPDPQRQLALLRDEAATRRAAGDLRGACHALARARQLDEQDPALQQEYAGLVVERLQTGEDVPATERTAGAELLVGLAEAYDGEHGLAYSAGALDILPGHDRALQLYAHYARALAREDEVATRYLAYLEANPEGVMAPEARWQLAGSYEAAGQPENAIQILEPLRGRGDEQATAKVAELYAQAGQAMPAAPPPPAAAQPGSHAPSAGQRRAPPAVDATQTALDEAQSLAHKGRRPDAYRRYREVLESDPAHPEALSWVEDYLRTKRDYGALRDVLLAATRAAGESLDTRKERLREVAGICEGNLRDVDGAINAWKQLLSISRTDDAARQALTRLLEKAQRWDDLANLIEQEASSEGDLEKRIALEKKLAALQENKRKDLGAAGESWARIANLSPEDDQAITTASNLFEKSGQIDRAAEVIAENAPQTTDASARSRLLERLGRLREKLGDALGAGEAYAEAAHAQPNAKLWASAEQSFTSAERWDRAALAAAEQAQAATGREQAPHYARAAGLFRQAGDDAGALAHLERAADLDPASDEHAKALGELYGAGARWTDYVEFLLRRGDRLTDKAARVLVRKQAAQLYASQLADPDAARSTWHKVLEDGDDKEALERLVDDAAGREEHAEATALLRRLGATAETKAEKARLALREGEILAEGVGDVDAAIARYEQVLSELDPACRPALQAIADLQEAREKPAAAAEALERELALVSNDAERGPIAARLARIYEPLGDAKSAIRTLEIVRKADPEDFEALARLCDLCEKTEQWDKTVELLAARIEVEADEAEIRVLTLKLADALASKLNRGDEGLAVLTELADTGDAPVREAYVALGDRLGWRGIVATKLVEWWLESRPSPERVTNLRGAFDRYVEVGRDQDAIRVATELVRSKGADATLAEQLEELAVKARDLDAIAIAHDLRARELSGLDRARELVRQAEARVKAGAPALEALQHGESGLANVPPADAEELLAKLAALAERPSDVVDLYERQIGRCKAPADRVKALARAAQVAVSREQGDRAHGFFELALGGSASDETLAVLEQAARDGDAETGGDALRRTLSASLAAGGQGARDGGKTRGSLLRRAASLAHRDLDDLEQAFTWLGDALIAHVDPLTLDALEALGREVGDPKRAEATLTRALGEVFDGPLVRQLLARRAKLRRERLDDRPGAAVDLKKLHDLSPNDQAVIDELSGLLTELDDFRGLVQLFEDQILRGKDMTARAELARKVARMWEERLADPREAADAWRRVLRMKQGDTEATAGLERAKSNMLRKPEPGSEPVAPKAKPASAAPPAEVRSNTDRAPASADAPAETPAPVRADPLSASLRAALAPEPEIEDAEVRGPARAKPQRPEGLFFRTSSAEDATVSAPLTQPEMDPVVPIDDDPTAAGEMNRTSELAALDFSDVTLAPTSGGDDVPVAAAAADEDDEVIIADDLAEIVEGEEDAGPPTEPPPADAKKRSIPPPIPRQ